MSFKEILSGALTVGGSLLAMFGGPYAPLGYAMIVAGAGLAATEALNQKNQDYKKPANQHQINTRSSRQPLPLIYGESQVGVNKTYYLKNNPYLWIVCEIGEGPLEGIKNRDGTYYTTTDTSITDIDNPVLVYFDEKLWTSYGGTSNVWMKFYNGSSTQTVCSDLATASGGAWTEPLRYTAYLVIRLKFHLDYFKQEPDVTLIVRGVNVTDPIASTTAWTANPALCAYDFLTRSSQRGGLEIDTARIDATSLETARDYCTTKGWTCNLPLADQQAASDNLEHILACYRGAIIYSEALFKFRFADLNYESVSLALTEDDVVEGSLSISLPDISDRPNAICATHYDSSKKYKANDLTFSRDSEVTADGDYRELKINLFGLATNSLVQKMIYYILERERLKKTVTLVAGERCAALEPYDIITLTHSMPGWEEQYLRVINAVINPEDHTVALSCQYEDIQFYDDAYNITEDDYDSTTLIDPSEAPPEVESVSLTETTYVYRLRTQSRLDVSFTAPTDYPWFDHVEVWVSLDDATWKHQFNSTEDFTLDPVEEGQTYYIKLVSVNIFGTKIPFDSAPKFSAYIDGINDTEPTSLISLRAIYTGTTLNVFADKVNEGDIELYEFRLGATWTGAAFLSATRSPNLSIGGIRPGTHTIWCDTLGTNGLYGDTPVSVTVTIPDPPPGWSVVATAFNQDNLLTEGDMEVAAGVWVAYDTPTVNALSTEQVFEGSNSRKVTIDAVAEGIYQSSVALTADRKMSWSMHVFPLDPIDIQVIISDGHGTTVYPYNSTFTGLTTGQFNFLSGTYTEPSTGGGSSGRFYIIGKSTVGTFYVDNVALVKMDVANNAAYLYNSEVYFKNTHPNSTSLSGKFITPIYDVSTIGTFFGYINTSFSVIGGGGNWEDKFLTTSQTWLEAFESTSQKWTEFFTPTAAPQIKMKINYGDSTALGSAAEMAEISGAIMTGRYFQLETSVTDPSPDIYGLVKSPGLKLCT